MLKKNATYQINKNLPNNILKIELIENIGEGGFGIVFSAKIHYTNGAKQMAAVKVIRDCVNNILESSQETQMFLEIIEDAKGANDERTKYLLQSLFIINSKDKDGNITGIYPFNSICDFSLNDFICYININYARALNITPQFNDIKKAVMEKMYKKFIENPKELFLFIKHCYEGLAVIHSYGFVHRDIKPANILIFYDKTTQNFIPKITDFGMTRKVSKYYKQHKPYNFMAEICPSFSGTLIFNAPELFCQVPSSHPTSDIWSMGFSIYSFVSSIASKYLKLSCNSFINEMVPHYYKQFGNYIINYFHLFEKCRRQDGISLEDDNSYFNLLNKQGSLIWLVALMDVIINNDDEIPDYILSSSNIKYSYIVNERHMLKLLSRKQGINYIPPKIDEVLLNMTLTEKLESKFKLLRKFIKKSLNLDPLKRQAGKLIYSDISTYEHINDCVNELNEICKTFD